MVLTLPIAWVLIRGQGGTIKLTIVNEDEADVEDLQAGKRFEEAVGNATANEEGEIIRVFSNKDRIYDLLTSLYLMESADEKLGGDPPQLVYMHLLNSLIGMVQSAKEP